MRNMGRQGPRRKYRRLNILLKAVSWMRRLEIIKKILQL
tara:strand:- start:597 stop:713 length:117 start_codon:yes stop_codon:yes gene_type:complete